jgi:hypothetical protein
MRLRTVIECAVIVAAASVAAASDYGDRAEQVTLAAKYATCEAQSLPVLSPLPDYEYFRCLALSDAADATNLADVATAAAGYADSWWKKYSYQMVLRATNQQWSPTKLAEAKTQYDAWVAKSLEMSRKAEAACGLSRNAAMSARLYLDDQ